MWRAFIGSDRLQGTPQGHGTSGGWRQQEDPELGAPRTHPSHIMASTTNPNSPGPGQTGHRRSSESLPCHVVDTDGFPVEVSEVKPWYSRKAAMGESSSSGLGVPDALATAGSPMINYVSALCRLVAAATDDYAATSRIRAVVLHWHCHCWLSKGTAPVTGEAQRPGCVSLMIATLAFTTSASQAKPSLVLIACSGRGIAARGLTQRRHPCQRPIQSRKGPGHLAFPTTQHG